MVTDIIGRISDGREALTVGIACLCESLLSLCNVGLIILADIGAAAVCRDRVVDEHTLVVNYAGADKVISRGVGALHDGVRNILTVNNKAESLTDIDVVEGSLLIVHAEIVGAEIGVDIEVAAVGCLLEARDFLGGNILYHESLAAGVSGIRSGRILEKEEGKLLGNDLAVIPAALIVGVLLAYDLLAGSPLGDHVGAVADIGLGLGCPFVAVLFNGSLLNGAHGAESNDLVEVRAGICKLDGESLAVLAGLNIELIAIGLCGRFAFLIGVTRSIQIAFDHADNSRAVGGADIGIGNSLHGVLEVLGVELGAVGPLQAVTHGEGPGETVGADSVGLSLSGLNLVVFVDYKQCLKQSDEHIAAIDCTVKCRIESFRVGTDLNSDVVGLLLLFLLAGAENCYSRNCKHQNKEQGYDSLDLH